MFGALVLGQAWLVWHARKINEGEIRRAFVQAYFGVFSTSTLALLRSHLTDPYWHPVRNPVAIATFGFLATFYGWFAFVQKPIVSCKLPSNQPPVTGSQCAMILQVFEGLPKTVS